MKWKPKKQIYEASNCNFNPKEKIATSYGWWWFVREVNGYLIFNTYSYSVSTSGHQNKVGVLLLQLGYKIDLHIESPRGLQDLKSATNYYLGKIHGLIEQMNRKGSHKKTNETRKKQIKHYKDKINQLIKIAGEEAKTIEVRNYLGKLYEHLYL